MTHLALALCAIALSIVGVEVGARLHEIASPAPLTKEEFLQRRPAPYLDADYLTEPFVAELIAIEPGVLEAVRDGVALPDFRGSYFNIRDGKRSTTGQPTAPTNAIHVFGGSTMFSNEVPDGETIPSHLQAALRDRFGDRFIVHNHGAPGLRARDQTARLRGTSLQPGDIVVFYDGTNEIYHGIYYGHAAPEVADPPDASRDEWSLAQQVTYAVWEATHAHSVFARRFLDVHANRRWSVPEHLRHSDSLTRLLENTRIEYRQALVEAADHCRRSGVTFLHFLQPTLFTRDEHTEYELGLIANHNIVFAGLEVAHRRGYQALRETLAESAATVPTIDLSDTFDTRPADAEYFLDDCHVTHAANAAVAQRLFAAIVALPN